MFSNFVIVHSLKTFTLVLKINFVRFNTSSTVFRVAHQFGPQHNHWYMEEVLKNNKKNVRKLAIIRLKTSIFDLS